MKKSKQEITADNVNNELGHLLEVFNQVDNLSAIWQCDCHCGLVITHHDAGTTLWLKYDEENNFYMLYCTQPEENFRGEAHKFKCLCEVSNYISFSNQAYPEYAINLQIMANEIEL